MVGSVHSSHFQHNLVDGPLLLSVVKKPGIVVRCFLPAASILSVNVTLGRLHGFLEETPHRGSAEI